MRDALGRNLPPLSHKNSMDRLFGIIEAPTDNVLWFDQIGTQLDQATASMNAERELKARGEMARFSEAFGLGIGEGV